MRAPSDCAAEKRSTEDRNSCLLPCRISCTQAFMSRPVRWKTCLHVNEGGVEGGGQTACSGSRREWTGNARERCTREDLQPTV